jgi:hypothetical protein
VACLNSWHFLGISQQFEGHFRHNVHIIIRYDAFSLCCQKKKKNPFQFKVLCGILLDVVQVTTCFVHKQISGKRCEGLIRLFRGFARASFHFLFLTLKAKKTRVYAPAAITLIIIGLLGMY